jgi:hypothetical protein
MLMRRWVATDLADAAGINVKSIYSALRGKRVSDRTALGIFRALSLREPLTDR